MRITESYEAIDSALRPVIEEVNKSIREGKVAVDGEQVELEFFLGGDYKVHVINVYIIYIDT